MTQQGERLQKVMAQAGVGSRRACEELIDQGRVSVDDAQVTRQGMRVTPDQVIRVDGERINFDETKVTIALHKPVGIVSTMDDDLGRPGLSKILENREERLYHVGRLDQDSEGLLLVSNDGELTHRLTHPSFEVSKTYIATVEGMVGRGIVKALTGGVELEDGIARADSAKIIEMGTKASIIELTLHSGRNRVVRRMFDELGHPVQRLVRTHFGTISLGRLKPGQYRVIGGSELGALMKSVGL